MDYSIGYLQNRLRNTISCARVGRVTEIAGGWRDHLVTFSHPITDGQIADLRAKNLDVEQASRNQIRIVLPESWLKKPVELDFEPLVTGPRPVNLHIVALTCVCSVCQCQYDVIHSKTFFEQNPKDAYALDKQHPCCPVCDKIERRKHVIAVQPLPPIIVIALPPSEPVDAIDELIAAAHGVLDWYRSLPFSYVGAPHRRLANALVPFEQQPAAALEIVK